MLNCRPGWSPSPLTLALAHRLDRPASCQAGSCGAVCSAACATTINDAWTSASGWSWPETMPATSARATRIVRPWRIRFAFGSQFGAGKGVLKVEFAFDHRCILIAPENVETHAFDRKETNFGNQRFADPAFNGLQIGAAHGQAPIAALEHCQPATGLAPAPGSDARTIRAICCPSPHVPSSATGEMPETLATPRL